MAHLGPATYDVNSQSIAVQSIRDAILKKTMKGKNSLICTNNTVTHLRKCGAQHTLECNIWFGFDHIRV